jgi:hypothetical protein
MNIVFVHGIAQQDKSEALIKAEWLRAIDLSKHNVIAPFYGRELYTAVLNESAPDRRTRSVDFANFVTEFGSEALGTSARGLQDFSTRGSDDTPPDKLLRGSKLRTDSKTKGRQDGRIDLLPPDRRTRAPRNWPVVRFLAQHLDARWPGVTGIFIGRFLRDVHLYLTNEEVRENVDRIVREKLPTKGKTVVIGHSLGSVVAYHVLSKYKPEVCLFLTLGSPLGIGAIRKRLNPKPHIPKCLPTWSKIDAAAWYNAYDPRDIVALNPLDNGNFGSNLRIFNQCDVKNTSKEHHGIGPYLEDLKVAERIAAACKS